MLFKVLIKLSDKKFQKLKLEDLFENLTFNKNKKNWNIEIFTKNLVKDQLFISRFLRLKVLKVERIKKKKFS